MKIVRKPAISAVRLLYVTAFLSFYTSACASNDHSETPLPDAQASDAQVNDVRAGDAQASDAQVSDAAAKDSGKACAPSPSCGSATCGADNCGTKCGSNSGGCPAGQSCGTTDGTPGTCKSCTPKLTCDSQSFKCGTFVDDCGTNISCGACTVGACNASHQCEGSGGNTDLSDKNASPRAVGLWNFLKSQYGKKMLSGCWTENLNGGGAKGAHDCSGKWPAIFGTDMCGWVEPRSGDNYMSNLQSQIDQALAAYNRGQIIQINWHWNNPIHRVTDGAEVGDSNPPLTSNEWKNIVTPGTSEYNTMIEDLDWHLENFLKKLSDASGQPIPILFRPLHEIDGGWFWWTSHDGKQTAELWRILYKYVTNTKGIHNLIWVYSAGVSPNFFEEVGGDWREPYGDEAAKYRSTYYPGAEYVDIAGIDLYDWNLETGKSLNYDSSYKTAWDCMQKVAPGKMLALAESQALPDATRSFNGDMNFAPWLYALPWFQNDENNPCSWVNTSYNNSNVINLNDLSVH